MRILVPYQAGEQGLRQMYFAGDIASRMDVPLVVFLPTVSEEESARIKSCVETFGFVCEVIAADLETMTNELGSIYVMNTFPKRMDLTILSPFWENAWPLAADHRVLIPFGGQDAGRFATATVMPVLKTLGFRVIFYHTTWREGVGSENPADHMAPAARVTQQMIEELARDAGVPYTVVIETAPDVTEGIILAALKYKASLIVTAHGLNVIAGSYATQLRMGPVPLLTIGRTEVMA